jgi:hypothetical protein
MRTYITEPVRKIPLGTNSLRGKTISEKNNRQQEFESALERDFLQGIEFDINVLQYCVQPVKIEYIHEGVVRHYTPDVIVYYRDDIEPAMHFKPMLCEIKYRKNLKENWKELKPKFMAALRYADEQGWRFKIVTEKEIRTEYFANAKFLNFYKSSKFVNESDVDLLLFHLNDIKSTTPDELLLMATNNKEKRAELLYTIWYLVANYFINCDLSNLLDINSTIWID